jgi:hypothetical protein
VCVLSFTNRVVGPVDPGVLVAYVEEDLGGNVTSAVEVRIARQ